MTFIIRASVLVGALGAMSTPQSPTSAVDPWPDTFVSRLEALALMQTINAQILGSRSSTSALEAWCHDRRLAPEPKIVAVVLKGTEKPVATDQRARLQVTEADPVRYRRVELHCGATTLAEADNWYVPARLTPEMNRVLDTTATPFGTVVRPLEPSRQTLSVTILWSPLPDGWERGVRPPDAKSTSLAVPDALFEHRALLYTRDRIPFSEVRETYRRELLGSAPPR